MTNINTFNSDAKKVAEHIVERRHAVALKPKHFVSNEELSSAAKEVAKRIKENVPVTGFYRIFGVPRGGVPAAYLVKHALYVYQEIGSKIVSSVDDADVVVDDLIDSGKTAARYLNKPFYALFDKRNSTPAPWYVFPWESLSSEGTEVKDQSADDIVVRLMQRIGENPQREGLKETPQRYVKALDEWFAGYRQNPEDVLKAFEDGAEGASDGLVIVGKIPFYSHCEHHIAPIFGEVAVGYIPTGRIVGLSKMKRLVDVFSRRLQVQERLTNQIADALDAHLQPKGVGVVIRARHMCMESRGVGTPGSITTTSALRGVLLHNAAARQEFMELSR